MSGVWDTESENPRKEDQRVRSVFKDVWSVLYDPASEAPVWSGLDADQLNRLKQKTFSKWDLIVQQLTDISSCFIVHATVIYYFVSRMLEG